MDLPVSKKALCAYDAHSRERKVVASDRARRPNVLRHILLIYANNEPKSALARDLGDCRDNKGKLAKRVFTCSKNFSNRIDNLVS